jgi:AcrR family transcriptional regulator
VVAKKLAILSGCAALVLTDISVRNRIGTREREAMSDNRETILRAATSSIAASGLRGLRVNDVAASANVSSGLIYYHFTDRAGLLAATLDHINTEFARGTGAQDARSALLGELGASKAVRESSVAWNELRASAVFDAALAPAIATTTHAWNDSIAAAIGGESADVDAEILTSLVEGLAARWLSGTISRPHAEALLRRAIDSILDPPSR